MANFPDIFVARKISSSEYDHNMHPKGISIRHLR